MPNFESFSRDLVSLKSGPTVTLQRRGLLSLNRAAFLALRSPAAVDLLFDREASVLGLRPAAVTAAHAAFVRRAGRSANGPWVVSAMAFVRYYDIDLSVSRRWPAHLDGGVLCVDLTGPSTVVTTSRSAAEPVTEGDDTAP